MRKISLLPPRQRPPNDDKQWRMPGSKLPASERTALDEVGIDTDEEVLELRSINVAGREVIAPHRRRADCTRTDDSGCVLRDGRPVLLRRVVLHAESVLVVVELLRVVQPFWLSYEIPDPALHDLVHHALFMPHAKQFVRMGTTLCVPASQVVEKFIILRASDREFALLFPNKHDEF